MRPDVERSRLVAVVNPATRRNADAIVAILRAAVPAGIDLDIRLTFAANTATAVTAEALAGGPTPGAVVAVGGDGTVADVATALRGTTIPLGIIPAGSTNIVARELGIPNRAADAVALLFSPHTRIALDVGRCDGRSFLHMAGAGLDSRLFAAANPALKRRIGWPAYLPPAARNLFRSMAHFTVTADSETFELVSPLVLVANGGSVASPRLRLYPGLRKDDGWLDVLVFTAALPLTIARTLGAFAARRLDRSPYVLHRRARHVELFADPPLPLQLDGDVVASTPATFDIEPAAIRVIVPPR